MSHLSAPILPLRSDAVSSLRDARAAHRPPLTVRRRSGEVLAADRGARLADVIGSVVMIATAVLPAAANAAMIASAFGWNLVG